MLDYINIGSSPVDESCAQVGDEDYYERSRKECRALIHQLRREFGAEPVGARLTVKGFSHDFGTYHEVICEYDTNSEKAVNYAFSCENETPQHWDEKAKQEINS